MSEHQYGIRHSTILNAIQTISKDLEYLCALVEKPDDEYVLKDAVAYSRAVVALTYQLEFFLHDIAANDLSTDGEHVKLTTEQIFTMQDYAESAEEAMKELEKLCGISLQSN